MKCQVRSILVTGKQSKVEIEGLQRQIKQLHMDSFKVKAGELETVEKEVVTEFGDNVLLQEIATGASLYIEVTRVIDS